MTESVRPDADQEPTRELTMRPADYRPEWTAVPAAVDPQALTQRLAGRYRVDRELGQGGMGKVFQATDLRLGRPVAIKTLLPQAVESQDRIQRLRLEAQVVAGLQHPNIIQVYEVLDLDGLPVVVMEYVEGQELGAAIAGDGLPERQTAEILAQVCEAVGYAHQHGVIHRDIKPANILLMAGNVPKVMDFGIAKRIDAQSAEDAGRTMDGSVLGSPAYMAPEQARGDVRNVDSRSDVYALGGTFYHALTGQRPFTGRGYGDALQQILTGELVPPSVRRPGVDRDLEAICLKAMERDPERRYRSALAMAEDLRRALQGLPVTARRYGLRERLRRAVGRRRELFLLSLAVVAVMYAAIAAAVLALHATGRSALLEEVRHRLTDLASTAVLAVDPQKVDAVRGREGRERPEAGDLARALRLVRERSPDIRSVWIMRPATTGPTTMEFVVEDCSFVTTERSRTECVPGPGETAPAMPGDTVEVGAYPELLRGMQVATADREYATDAWGVALSGYAPIRDAAGRAIAVLGVDVARADVVISFRRLDRSVALALAVLSVLALALVGLVLAWIVGLWRLTPVGHE
jgi:hypothetical protein